MNKIQSDGEKYWNAYDKRYVTEMSKVQDAGVNYWKQFHQRYAETQREYNREVQEACLKPKPYKVEHVQEDDSKEKYFSAMEESFAKQRQYEIEKKEYEQRTFTKEVDKRVDKIIYKLEQIAEQMIRTNKLIQDLNDKL